MRVSSLAKRMAQVAYPLLKCSGQDSFRFLRFLNFGIFAKFPTSWKIFNMNIWSVSTSQTVRDHDSLHEDSECWTFEILYYQTRQCLTCPVCICGLNSGLSRWATTPTWWRSLVCWSFPQELKDIITHGCTHAHTCLWLQGKELSSTNLNLKKRKRKSPMWFGLNSEVFCQSICIQVKDGFGFTLKPGLSQAQGKIPTGAVRKQETSSVPQRHV